MSPDRWRNRAARCGVDAVVDLAWVANRYAVKAWASLRLRLTRCHERGPGEELFGLLLHSQVLRFG